MRVCFVAEESEVMSGEWSIVNGEYKHLLLITYDFLIPKLFSII